MESETAVLVTGGTGFLGKPLVSELAALGYFVIVLTRQTDLTLNKQGQVLMISSLSQIPKDIRVVGVINLAGESLNAKRWNDRQKQVIYDSRIETTHLLVDWSESLDAKLEFFISGSAIGWYGHRQDELLDENSAPGKGFAAVLCQDWEAKASQANAKRVVMVRTGIVLEEDGGPLKEMLLPFKLGAGGPMGDGKQIWSWIHRKDWVLALLFLIREDALSGAFNFTAPEALPQKTFAQVLAKTLGRPAIIPMPKLMARAVLGEFADEVLLNGQRVFPKRLLDAGYQFSYPSLDSALNQILVEV